MYINFHSIISIYNTLQLLFNRVKWQQNLEVIYEQRERVFHRDIQTRENNVWCNLVIWFFLCWCCVLRWICMFVMLLWVYIHTGRAWKICPATVGIEPTTFGILAPYIGMVYIGITLVSKELDSVPKYHLLEPTWPRSSVGRALG